MAECEVQRWGHSIKANAKPVLEEVNETVERPRWVDRVEFVGLGAAGVGMLRALFARRGRKRWRMRGRNPCDPRHRSEGA